MNNSKLLELLKTFSAAELRELKDFIASPFFNKNKELNLFYNYLKRMAPNFPDHKIKGEYVYKILFPKQVFDKKHLHYLMSFTLKLAEQYIGYKEYSQQETLPEYHMLSSFVKRNLDKHYRQLFQKTANQIEHSQLRNSNYFYRQYLLADIADRHFGTTNQRKHNESLQKAANYFDNYYLSNKLKYAIEMINTQEILSGQFEIAILKEVKQYLSNSNKSKIPPIDIYYQILLMLTESIPSKYFENVKILLRTHAERFTTFEIKQCYLLVLNFCLRNIRKGQSEYAEEALELYVEGIQNKVLYENNYLSPWTYKNVISLGIGLQRYDWTTQFIHDYNQQLAPTFQENALNYNLADLYFRKQDYDKAQYYLREVEYSDIYYQLGARIMLLKIFYETNEKEALHSQIASFSIFLKRNKLIANNVRESYQNFVKYLNKLIKKNPSKSGQLKKDIEGTKLLMYKNWLLEKLTLL